MNSEDFVLHPPVVFNLSYDFSPPVVFNPPIVSSITCCNPLVVVDPSVVSKPTVVLNMHEIYVLISHF